MDLVSSPLPKTTWRFWRGIRGQVASASVPRTRSIASTSFLISAVRSRRRIALIEQIGALRKQTGNRVLVSFGSRGFMPARCEIQRRSAIAILVHLLPKAASFDLHLQISLNSNDFLTALN
jgi:hypothetical protein